MTTRRKGIKLRAYDYLAGFNIVVAELAKKGEPTKLTPTESSMVDHAVEIAAEQRFTPEQAEATMKEVAAYITTTRGETLFPVFNESDNMGDDCGAPSLALDEARRAVA